MDTSQHTVTLPINDYNELLQIKKEHSYMSTAIEAIRINAKQGERVAGVNVKERIFSDIIESCENAKEPF